jgi:hypothetical protein
MRFQNWVSLAVAMVVVTVAAHTVATSAFPRKLDRDKTGTTSKCFRSLSSQVTASTGVASLGSFKAERQGLSYRGTSLSPVWRRTTMPWCRTL